ncbi:MAG: alpha/beta hydrolase [Parvibaculum sp.]|jgi:pimeloyl-ACP methyl ester carboxylesterase|uniref:alpha/beta hydrolase n=1 Tax=Parvibaculum sp. TaxID=2024848 RepID=UPI00283DF72F|nr:alpha/beta hydrolase [Parvibaculum sp.]MDR3497594.1 alpha/beta hydrolase [Parvibaculum sp.]
MMFQTGLDLLRIQGDVLWAGAELTAKIVTEPFLGMLARKGDGKTPVMTLPGFTGPEFSLQPLNQFLRANGYVAHSWGLGTNRGVRDMAHMDSIATKLGARIRELADTHERKVSLIGQSLGGVFARELARRFPNDVDRVITLGSPAHFGEAPKNVNAMVARVMALYTGRAVADLIREVEELDFNMSEPPAGVPLVSIYSLYDGVAPVATTRIPTRFLDDADGVPRENIEIVCSHCGMGVNPLVLLAVADRLAEDETNWMPFDPLSYGFGPVKYASRWFYPSRLTPRVA